MEFLTQECGGKKLQKIIYMSDGCAAQHKNCNNFVTTLRTLVSKQSGSFLPHLIASLQEMALEEH